MSGPLRQEMQPATAPPFPAVDAWRNLLELAARDVRGEASPAISSYLRQPENLVPWARALIVIRHDVEGRIADSRKRLAALAAEEDAGNQLTARYRQEKAAHDLRLAARTRFHTSVLARAEECTYLMGRAGVHRYTSEEGLLATILRAVDLLDHDDVEAAHGLLAAAVRRAQAGRR